MASVFLIASVQTISCFFFNTFDSTHNQPIFYEIIQVYNLLKYLSFLSTLTFLTLCLLANSRNLKKNIMHIFYIKSFYIIYKRIFLFNLFIQNLSTLKSFFLLLFGGRNFIYAALFLRENTKKHILILQFFLANTILTLDYFIIFFLGKKSNVYSRGI